VEECGEGTGKGLLTLFFLRSDKKCGNGGAFRHFAKFLHFLAAGSRYSRKGRVENTAGIEGLDKVFR